MKLARVMPPAWVLNLAMCVASAMAGPNAGAVLTGADFACGREDTYGAAKYNQPQVKYVYARPTGDKSSMQATFELVDMRTTFEPDIAWTKKTCQSNYEPSSGG